MRNESNLRFRTGSVSELMEQLGISAAELGRRVGVSRQAVAAYVIGVSTPQLATVAKMAEVGRKPLEFFVERAGARTDVSNEGENETQRVAS